MKLLTQTKWPVPVLAAIIVGLFVLENRKVLTADQVQWVVGFLALGGTQVGVHTDRPISKEPAPDTRTHITLPPKGDQ